MILYPAASHEIHSVRQSDFPQNVIYLTLRIFEYCALRN